jgi:hypothetical protein
MQVAAVRKSRQGTQKTPEERQRGGSGVVRRSASRPCWHCRLEIIEFQVGLCFSLRRNAKRKSSVRRSIGTYKSTTRSLASGGRHLSRCAYTETGY